MKTISTLVLCLIVSLTSYSQTYRIYTATANGNFNNAGTWSNVVRTDGVPKNKYIIPNAYTVTVPSGGDYTLLGDIDVVVLGTLNLAGNAVFALTQNSTIEIPLNGRLRTNGIGAVIIGSSWKLLTFGVRQLDGPLFADFTTTGFTSLFTLSVDFLTFTASLNNNDVTLKWSTANETNNSHFDVEVSANGRDWSKIGVVKGVNNRSAVNNYSFIHNNISGFNLSYRLKQVDLNGNFEYSTVVVIKSTQKNQVNITSSAAALKIEFPSEVKSTVLIRMINSNGQVVFSKTANSPFGKCSFDISGLRTGIYAVQVADGNSSVVKQVMIN